MKRRFEGQNENKEYKILPRFIRKAIAFLLIINLVAIGFYNIPKSEAAGNQVNVIIDYLEEQAIVTAGTGGSSVKFYMSTDNMKTWELLEATNVIDISGLLKPKEVSVYFKGNKETTPVQQVLQAEDNSLKATYQIINGAGSILLSGASGPVEFRKGTNGQWKTATNLMSTAVYELKGTTLYFRTVATSTKRAGKIVTVRVPKKPTAPSVKVDGSKLNISGLKYGETQYRLGDSTTWITFKPLDEKIKILDLATLLFPIPTTNVPLPAGTIEFRTLGSDKKLNSAVKTLEIPAQVQAPNTINLSGTTLTITDNDYKLAYEYTVVENNKTLNLATAKWTTVYSSKNYLIPKVSVGDKIYVRVKSRTDSVTKQTILASTYKEIVVTTISPNIK
jgi:hypothetical protein